MNKLLFGSIEFQTCFVELTSWLLLFVWLRLSCGNVLLFDSDHWLWCIGVVQWLGGRQESEENSRQPRFHGTRSRFVPEFGCSFSWYCVVLFPMHGPNWHQWHTPIGCKWTPPLPPILVPWMYSSSLFSSQRCFMYICEGTLTPTSWQLPRLFKASMTQKKWSLRSSSRFLIGELIGLWAPLVNATGH